MQTQHTNESTSRCSQSKTTTSAQINQLRTIASHLLEVSQAMENQIPMNASDVAHGLKLSSEDKAKFMSRKESLILLPCLRNAQRIKGIISTIERLACSLDESQAVDASQQS